MAVDDAPVADFECVNEEEEGETMWTDDDEPVVAGEVGASRRGVEGVTGRDERKAGGRRALLLPPWAPGGEDDDCRSSVAAVVVVVVVRWARAVIVVVAKGVTPSRGR